jgi:hypothetical protein
MGVKPEADSASYLMREGENRALPIFFDVSDLMCTLGILPDCLIGKASTVILSQCGA